MVAGYQCGAFGTASNGQCTGKDLPHLPKLKLVALCNRLGVRGLLGSLVVAFLAVAVRSNSGFRTAIIRMLVFHPSTSALPVHNRPLRGDILHPLAGLDSFGEVYFLGLRVGHR